MHAVFITFVATSPADELGPLFEQYARQLTAAAGLFSKSWIADGSLVGGCYVFDTATEAAPGARGVTAYYGVACRPAFYYVSPWSCACLGQSRSSMERGASKPVRRSAWCWRR